MPDSKIQKAPVFLHTVDGLTAKVRQSLTTDWNRRLHQQNENISDKTAEELRGYLMDPLYCGTPGFILRRYIQASQSSLLTEACQKAHIALEDVPDLQHEKNLPWPDKLIGKLALVLVNLQKLSGSLPISSDDESIWRKPLTTHTWQAYLSDKTKEKKRIVALQMAVFLQMDPSTTAELLNAIDGVPFNMRAPHEYLCFVAQRAKVNGVPLSFDLAWVERMYSAYKQRCAASPCPAASASSPSAGMTSVLHDSAESLASSHLSAPEFEQALLAYMVAHQADFSGYSLTNYHRLLQLCDFTRWQINMGATADASSPQLNSRYTMSDKDFLHAYACRALDTLLLPSGFVPDCSSIFSNLGSADPDKETDPGVYSQEGQAYYHAMDAIIVGKEPVARRDVLILLVLLIDQLECENYDGARDAIRHTLKEHKEHPLDDTANAPIDAELECDLARALGNYEDPAPADLQPQMRYRLRCALCDKILGRFGFLALYPPNPMDRLVMFSFLSDDIRTTFFDSLSRDNDL